MVASQQPPPPLSRGERFMIRFARLLTRVFFREIEVVGRANLPLDRPVVLVANHVNGLVDGLVLMATLDRFPRFLGKATLFKILPIVPLLKMARVIPVHRAQDAGSAPMQQNASAFRTCREVLLQHGLVALFPEGISHDEAAVQPLKTGAARIALEATVDDGVRSLVTVAVGLTYENKSRFRSRALVRIAAPEPVDALVDAYIREPTTTVKALTEGLDLRLREVAPDFDSIEDALEWSAIASIVDRSHRADGHIAAQDDIARALGQRARDHRIGPEVAALRDAHRTYAQALATLGITDEQLAAAERHDQAPTSSGRRAAIAVAAAPVVALGVGIHAAPYALMKQIGKLPKNEGIRATVKVLGCLALFSITYVTFGVVVGRRRGLAWGLVAFASGPLSGYVTLHATEQLHEAGGIARATRTLTNAAARSDLRAQRRRVVTQAEVLLAS